MQIFHIERTKFRGGKCDPNDQTKSGKINDIGNLRTRLTGQEENATPKACIHLREDLLVVLY